MKRILSAILIILNLLTLVACGNSAPTWQEQYDLGIRYLEDGNYEEAIIAFRAAIKIDPKQADAYLGLSYAYASQNDFENAKKVLEEGYMATEDVRLKERNEQINLLNVVIERKDYSTYKANGDLEITLYYDLAQLSEISAQAKQINEMLQQDYEEWLPEKEEYKDRVEKSIAEGNENSLYKEIDAWTIEKTYQDDYCLSFREYHDTELAYRRYYGRTFDMRSGELITLQKLFGEECDDILKTFGYEHIPGGKDAIENGWWDIEKLNYYIATDGEIILQTPPGWNALRFGEETPMGIYIKLIDGKIVADGVDSLTKAEAETLSDQDYEQIRQAIWFYEYAVESETWDIYSLYGYEYVGEGDYYSLYSINGNPSIEDVKASFYKAASIYLSENLIIDSMEQMGNSIRIIDGKTCYLDGHDGSAEIADDSYQYYQENNTVKVSYNYWEKNATPDVVVTFIRVNGQLLMSEYAYY